MRQEVVKLHEEINSLTNKNRSVSQAIQQVIFLSFPFLLFDSSFPSISFLATTLPLLFIFYSVSNSLQTTEILSEHQKMAHDKDKQIIKMVSLQN